MSGDQLNLDAIERRAKWCFCGDEIHADDKACHGDVPVLVAEVRRLRSLLDDAGVSR